VTARKLTRRQALGVVGAGAAGAAASTAAVVGVATLDRERAAALSAVLTAPFSADGVPAEDPGSRAWRRGDAIRVELLPQTISAPTLPAAGVRSLVLRALHDGRSLGFLLEWEDDAADDLPGIARYQDAAAVQLPARAGTTPPITMGAPGQPVHVLQWRASWQRDLDEGRSGVAELYPNAATEVYPEGLLEAGAARLWSPGTEAGNPLSVPGRSPVEELVAEGFGTATSIAPTGARGAGSWAGGRWRVALAVPLERGPAGARIEPGSTWPAAFAVWAGSRGNRGGRKQFADWVAVTLEAA
jgi:hypothetical protein